jgi:hypothetical protein
MNSALLPQMTRRSWVADAGSTNPAIRAEKRRRERANGNERVIGFGEANELLLVAKAGRI